MLMLWLYINLFNHLTLKLASLADDMIFFPTHTATQKLFVYLPLFLIIIIKWKLNKKSMKENQGRISNKYKIGSFSSKTSSLANTLKSLINPFMKYISNCLWIVRDGSNLPFLQDDFKFETQIGVKMLENIDIFP